MCSKKCEWAWATYTYQYGYTDQKPVVSDASFRMITTMQCDMCIFGWTYTVWYKTCFGIIKFKCEGMNIVWQEDEGH